MTDGVWVFFYGGLINPSVQESVGLRVRRQEKATLHNFAIDFDPWVNLRPVPGESVFGLLMEVSHDDLIAAYSKLKVDYRPWPVLAATVDGACRPALCYIAPEMPGGPIDPEHVENLAKPAANLGFPAPYVDRIRSFIPRNPSN